MQVSIYSRQEIEKLIKGDFPKDTAVISFYDPPDSYHNGKSTPVKYENKAERIFYVAIYDIDLEVLPKFGLNYGTYFPEAEELAKFIINVKKDGLNIICQCEYGESRSSGCAAAILEYFYKTGISVFADYKYYPNQVVYHKVYDALTKIEKNNC